MHDFRVASIYALQVLLGWLAADNLLITYCEKIIQADSCFLFMIVEALE